MIHIFPVGNKQRYKSINVRVIAKRTLRGFWTKHADSEQQLTAWYRETEKLELRT